MKRSLIAIALLGLTGSLLTLNAQEELKEAVYIHGPDSERQPGIPQGEVTKYTWKSEIFEDTIRHYWVYVPRQYDGKTPAALMVFQDGHAYIDENGDFRTAIVFDNLIHKREMPVTIGLFITPGHKGDAVPDNPFRSDNRRFEYDSMTDQYARFLIDELIPELAQNFKLTDDRKMRAIGGLSSGAICAFTAAWERTDYFHKVLSHIGSYTNIRGGHVYPSLIRQEKKDIKIFLQDGSNDLDNQYGNWWLANLQMESSLKFQKYDYRFVAGTGGHNGKHAGAILPESLKWLWSDVTN